MLRPALIFAQLRIKSAFKRKDQSWSKGESGFLSYRKKNVLVRPNRLSWLFKKDLATVTFPAYTKSTEASRSPSGISVLSTATHVLPASWVERTSFEQAVIKNFTSNWDAYANNGPNNLRQNDFRGLLIPGGIGVGKTRAAHQIPYIVANYLNTATGPDAAVREHFAAVVYLSLDYRRVVGMLYFRGYSETQRRPSSGHSDAIIANLLYYAYSSVLTSPTSSEIAMNREGLDIDRLLNDVYTKTGAASTKPLLLYLHVDEYQLAPYHCLALARSIGNYNTRPSPRRALIVLVFSGLGSTRNIGNDISGANYNITPVFLELSVKQPWLFGLADHFINEMTNVIAKTVLLDFKQNNHHIYYKLLATSGGIPKFVQELLFALVQAPFSADTLAAAQYTFNVATQRLRLLYNTTLVSNAAWFEDPAHIKILLQKAFFKHAVSRDERLNGATVGDLEQSGMIYLINSGSQRLIGLPLMMLHHLNSIGGLNLFAGLQFINNPFATLNEDDFEKFIAEVYAFSWRLLRDSAKKVTLQHFHRNLLEGKQMLLKQTFDLGNEGVSVVSAAADQTGLRKNTYRLVDVPTALRYSDPANAYVLRTRKRDSAPNIVLPGRLQVQLKWSLRSADSVPVTPGHRSYQPSDATTYIDLNLIRNEAAKGLSKLPFILISPKLLKENVLFNMTTTPREYNNVGLITGANCFKFMEPFYTRDVEDDTIVTEVPETTDT